MALVTWKRGLYVQRTIFLAAEYSGNCSFHLSFSTFAMLSLQPQAGGAFFAVYLFGPCSSRCSYPWFVRPGRGANDSMGLRRPGRNTPRLRCGFHFIAAALGALMSLI